MYLQQLRKLVHKWASDRDIYAQSTEEKQVDKFHEEAKEFEDGTTDRERKDAIGDMAVCIINAQVFQGAENRGPINLDSIKSLVDLGDYTVAMIALEMLANHKGYSFCECLEMAWSEIKDRKGMMVDGLYVKYSNLTPEQKKELDKRLG